MQFGIIEKKNKLPYREMRTGKPDWKGILCFDWHMRRKVILKGEGFFYTAKFPTCPIEKIVLFCDLYQKADCRKCICKRVRATITGWNGHLNGPELHHQRSMIHIWEYQTSAKQEETMKEGRKLCILTT